MTREYLDDLQKHFCREAIDVTGGIEIPEVEAFRAMVKEPRLRIHWWHGAFSQSDADAKAIREAARAFAYGQPRPPLSLAQRGRFALRLRLASRILRAYGHKNTNLSSEGWFPTALATRPEGEVIEWLLLEGAEVALEIFDETLLWEGELAFLDKPDDRYPIH